VKKETVCFAVNKKQNRTTKMTIEKSEVNSNVTNDVTNDVRETGFLIEQYRKWCQENNSQVCALNLLERESLTCQGLLQGVFKYDSLIQ